MYIFNRLQEGTDFPEKKICLSCIENHEELHFHLRLMRQSKKVDKQRNSIRQCLVLKLNNLRKV